MHVRNFSNNPLASLALLAVAACIALTVSSGCSPSVDRPKKVHLNANEEYLVEAYTKIIQARSYYPDQAEVAESLFTKLQADVDTTRIADTIAALNRDPDRWAAVYQEIEDRVKAKRRSQTTSKAGRPGS